MHSQPHPLPPSTPSPRTHTHTTASCACCLQARTASSAQDQIFAGAGAAACIAPHAGRAALHAAHDARNHEPRICHTCGCRATDAACAAASRQCTERVFVCMNAQYSHNVLMWVKEKSSAQFVYILYTYGFSFGLSDETVVMNGEKEFSAQKNYRMSRSHSTIRWEESDATEEETTRERTTRVGRPRER